MAHFVAYHSIEVMGRDYSPGVRFGFVTRKGERLLRAAIGAVTWVIVGRRSGAGTVYELAGRYTPDTLRGSSDDGWTIEGPGTAFTPRPLLTNLPWFSELKAEQNKFSLGFNRIRSPTVMAALDALMTSETHRHPPAPAPEQYEAALSRLEAITEVQVEMLRLHYEAPARTITAARLARALGYSHYPTANSLYGRLGRLVGERLDYNPMEQRLGTLVTFRQIDDEWHWIMRPELAQALERLGWVGSSTPALPEEVAPSAELIEGALLRISINAYERNPLPRSRCIRAHGTRCSICDFSFGETYGPVADGYIHVHHLRPLHEIRGEYTVDPVRDLRPVCPNCHAVLHLNSPPFSVEEARALLKGRCLRAVDGGIGD